MDIAEVIDARGLRCPLPVLRLRKRLLALPVGSVVRLETDDPMAVIDVPHFCGEAGHEMLDSREVGTGHVHLVRRGA